MQEHTVMTGFEKLENWGDLVSLTDRRFYLRRLVIDASAGQIRAITKFHPGGFDHNTSHLFLINQQVLDELIDLQTRVNDRLILLPIDIVKHSPAWKNLQEKMIWLSREYKIHLQPREENIPEVVSRLTQIILEDEFLQANIGGFKCKVCFVSDLHADNRANIIIYLSIKKKRAEARAMCRQVLARLCAGFDGYDDLAEDRLPIYNYPASKLISFIQVGTDAKFKLLKILGQKRFDQLFPKKFNQALLMDENIHDYI